MNEQEFKELTDKFSLEEISKRLNVAKGTVKRWIDNKNIPYRYTFDIHRHLEKQIDYSKYSQELKDQFFTPIDMAKECFETTKGIHL